MDEPTDGPQVFVVDHGGRGEPKRHQSVQATRLIHEHYGTIMAYSYSRGPLSRLVDEKFLGEWKYLHKALFEIPEQRVERALIELGLYIRLVDDAEDRLISKMRKGNSYGEIVRSNGTRDPLS